MAGMRDAALITESRMFIPTRHGEHEIQLLLGDITQLPPEEKVDVIIVSALHGDYTPTRVSVIGALYYNLNISVRELAYNKKEDLRASFNCWISQKLDKSLPYRQLICFERARSGNMRGLVDDLFRGMMPIFNNEQKSVITPLLGTGIQVQDPVKMMKILVHTAVSWMRMGLLLKCFKIVVFSRDPKNCRDPTIETFHQLKELYDGKEFIPKEPEIIYDVFVIYNDANKKLLVLILDQLKSKKSDIKIRDSTQLQSKEDSWQYQLYYEMLSCSRVVPILSESFVNNAQCVDQFNIALCCNRQTRRNILAPVLAESFEVPIYMGLVQWTSCKVDDAQKDKSLISSCSTILLEQINNLESGRLSYDVFISYCHKNGAHAQKLLHALQQTNSDLDIFFDSKELKTGVSWQQALYTALDNSRVVVSLLSTEYINSVVCEEEINLSLSRHFNKDEDLLLVPIYIEEIEARSCLNNVKCFKYPHFREKDAQNLGSIICDYLQNGNIQDNSVFKQKEFFDQTTLQEQLRKTLLHHCYNIERETLRLSRCQHINTPTTPPRGFTLFMSHVTSDQRHAQYLTETLQSEYSAERLRIQSSCRGDNVEKADGGDADICFIVFLSAGYVRSSKDMDDLNVILSNQRKSATARRLMYVIATDRLPAHPTYAHLVHLQTALTDSVWAEPDRYQPITRQLRRGSTYKSVSGKFGELTDCELVALEKCKVDIIHKVETGYFPEENPERGILLNIVDRQAEINKIKTDIKNSKFTHCQHLQKRGYNVEPCTAETYQNDSNTDLDADKRNISIDEKKEETEKISNKNSPNYEEENKTIETTSQPEIQAFTQTVEETKNLTENSFTLSNENQNINSLESNERIDNYCEPNNTSKPTRSASCVVL